MESTTYLPLTTLLTPENVTKVNSILRFNWTDYSFFCILLTISSSIGIFHGCFGNKQSTTVDYLHGGKKMNFIPVAISNIASHLSGITLLGIPAEIYLHGTEYSTCMVTSSIFTSLSIMFISLPVFYKLQLTSCYEYLTMRFDKRSANVGSLLFLFGQFIHLPIVVYVPSLAFNQVTGLSMYVTTPIVCAVCIFYTTIGGLKAVIWTDAIQFTVTLFTMIAIIIIGCNAVGGFVKIWEIAEENQRIEFFNLNLDPTIRTTFWTIAIGNSLTWINNNGFNPASLQKFTSVPKYSHAIKTLIMFCFGTMFTKGLACFSGLMMFAKYHDCDPLKSHKIVKNDQLLPYFILDVAGNIPGIGGLFIAGVFSTAMSTMASALNTISGTIYKNYVVNWMPKNTSDQTATKTLKLIVVIAGVIISCLVFVVDKLGAVLQVSMSFHGIVTGPHLSLFLIGMLIPSANKTGAFWGSLASLVVSLFISLGAQIYTVKGYLKNPSLPTTVANCDPPINITSAINSTIINNLEVPWIFRISFYYYPVIGVIVAISTSMIISYFTKNDEDQAVDADLLNPHIHRFLSKEHFRSSIPVKYSSIEKSLQSTTIIENDLKPMEEKNEEKSHLVNNE